MARRIVIPARFIRVDSGRGTVSIRNKSTGRFRGRRVVSNSGDRTKNLRLIKDTDLNHDGRIGPNEHGGLILGRTASTRASNRARAHTRVI